MQQECRAKLSIRPKSNPLDRLLTEDFKRTIDLCHASHDRRDVSADYFLPRWDIVAEAPEAEWKLQIGSDKNATTTPSISLVANASRAPHSCRLCSRYGYDSGRPNVRDIVLQTPPRSKDVQSLLQAPSKLVERPMHC